MHLSKYVIPAFLAVAMLSPIYASAAPEVADAPKAERQVRHHPADADKDGIVTRAEYDAHNAERFTKMDTNADGVITADEMKAAHQERREDMHKRMGEGRMDKEKMQKRIESKKPEKAEELPKQ